MILIASAAAKLRKQWARGFEGRFSLLEVANRKTLEQMAAKHKPSVLLLDLALPKLGWVDGLSAVQPLSPSTKIILFTDNPDDREAVRALKAGVKGYCNKDIDSNLLSKAVDVVQRGEIWVGRKVIPDLLKELRYLSQRRPKDPPLQTDIRFDSLTLRQSQIVRLVGDGNCNKDISRELNISERTVKAHLTAIFRKFNISDRLRLALMANQHYRISR